jgi:hypothetical protein
MFQKYVARVYFNCFRCFKSMLQVLCIDIVKVDQDVAHVIMAIHIFQVYVPNVSFVPDV